MKKKGAVDYPVKEMRIEDYSLVLFREDDPGESGYQLYAEVKELPGCFIAGDSEKEIIDEAPAVIDVYLEARKENARKKPKLYRSNSAGTYAFLVKYADEKGIENVSTAVRSLAVSKLREEGYNPPRTRAAAG